MLHAARSDDSEYALRRGCGGGAGRAIYWRRECGGEAGEGIKRRGAGGVAMALSMELLALGEQVGARLQARQETVAIAESAAGGLIAAALLAVSGASAYFLGGAVVYTRDAKT